MGEIRTFNNYEEMEKVHQKEVNECPIIWVFAFNDADFIQKMSDKIRERKPDCANITTMEDISKYVVSIGAGGFVLKDDEDAMNQMFSLHKAERKLFQQTEKHLVEAIVAEMRNHEYSYTEDPGDTLIALGKSKNDLHNNKMFARAWKKAEKKVLNTSVF